MKAEACVLDPVPFPGEVNRERLEQLLALQAESESLDYKQLYDLTEPASRFSFVKDAAAMMSRPLGGYLVVGVDEHGKPVDVEIDLPRIDESRLRPLLEDHLEGVAPLLSNHHDLDGNQVVLIFLGRRPDGLFPVVKKDCGYTDKQGKQKWALRIGDVLVRDGTETRRMRFGDLPELLAPSVEVARREERSRLGDIAEHLRLQYRGQAAAEGPATSLTWRLGAEDFDAALVELSRRHDLAALRLLMLSVSRDGTALVMSETGEEASLLRDLLDRAASALAYAVVLHDEDLLSNTVRALRQVYDACSGPGRDGDPRSGGAAETMVAIAARVLAVLGLAVRLKEWGALRPLTLQSVGEQYVTRSWLRHGLTWGYRHLAMPRYANGEPINGALISLARAAVDEVAALRLDLASVPVAPDFGQPPASVDPVLDSLCQADLLWCVISDLEGGRHDGRDFYPSFSALYEHRSRPAIRLLRTNSRARAELFPGRSVQEVKDALGDVLDMAKQQGVRFGFGDFSLGDDWGE